MDNNFSQINYPENKKPKEIDLKELYLVMKRRFLVILIFTVLAGMAGVYETLKPVAPLYQTSSKVIIGADQESQTTLQVIVKDSTVLDKVVKELNLNESSDTLAGQINVASIGGSQVVSISVIDTDPYRAAKIADTTAQVFKDEVPNIVGKDYVRLLSDAKVNFGPINPKSNKKMIYFTIFGLIAGIGFAFLLESLDDTIRSNRGIESIVEAPVLGRISKITNKNILRKNNKRNMVEQRGETIGYE